MIIVDELKEGFNIMLHPKSATQKKRKIGEAVAFYYKISIIPLLLYIILSLAMLIYAAGLSDAGMYFFGMLATYGILMFVVIIPIFIFVISFIYQIFGKLFKVFNNPYSNTFTATVYGALPTILFYWLNIVPSGSSVLIIFELWTFIIMVFALAKQQKTSIIKAFAVTIVTLIIIGIIKFIAFTMGLGSIFSLTL